MSAIGRHRESEVHWLFNLDEFVGATSGEVQIAYRGRAVGARRRNKIQAVARDRIVVAEDTFNEARFLSAVDGHLPNSVHTAILREVEPLPIRGNVRSLAALPGDLSGRTAF